MGHVMGNWALRSLSFSYTKKDIQSFGRIAKIANPSLGMTTTKIVRHIFSWHGSYVDTESNTGISQIHHICLFIIKYRKIKQYLYTYKHKQLYRIVQYYLHELNHLKLISSVTFTEDNNGKMVNEEALKETMKVNSPEFIVITLFHFIWSNIARKKGNTIQGPTYKPFELLGQSSHVIDNYDMP